VSQIHAHGHHHSAAGKNKRPLAIILVLTTVYMLAEVVGGLLTNSLALMADAGHMLTDVGGLGLAFLAISFAERPATAERTYGYYRVEILAALANAVVLIGISLFVLFEAYQRFLNPPVVQGIGVLMIALVGLAVNIVGIFILRSGAKESLNLKGAYFEVLSDMLASVGVIIAAVIMITTGWYYADPLISAAIGLFIFPRTWALLRDAVGVLLEGTPSDINMAKVRSALSDIAGVTEIHDLHVWSITSGMNALSVHAVLADGAGHDEVLKQIHDTCLSKFEIVHVTAQVEREEFACHEAHF
jgi:cobalt-zinc-cadmium efflux system protein